MDKRKKDDLPFVTVVVPCRNEVRYIEALLESIKEQDYPSERYEVILADGMSEDGTRDLINAFSERNKNFRLIDNPNKTVPFALNAAINVAEGDIIVRIDAHSIYPKNYISTLVKVLITENADNVGGVWETLPGDDTLTAKSIAIATSHPFGVGNAYYRLNSNNVEPYEVDTVPFGCYKKEVFDRIGYFDEELTRNQDNELNERLLKHGGKILLIPTLSLKYFARETYPKLWKMFYQYALFGPLVDKKLGKKARLRKYVPSIFVLSILLPMLGSLINKRLRYIAYISLAMYALCASFFSTCLAIKQQNLLLAPFIFLSFLVSHISYGFGYLHGYVKTNVKKQPPQVNMSR